MPHDCCPLCGHAVGELPVTILPERGMVIANGSFVTMPAHEAMLLERLAAVYPRMLSKQAAMEWLYQLEDREPEPKIIDVYICKIRKKIEKIGIRIDTLWGKGYVLATPIRILKEAA